MVLQSFVGHIRKKPGFYRARDVQRFYMVTDPEKDGKATANKQVYRLFLIGQKQMPEIVEVKQIQKKGIGH